jgi:hypothetical protein
MYYKESALARSQFESACTDAGSDMITEEQAILNIAREFLPKCALLVLDGQDLTPAQEVAYFEFLTEQVEAAAAAHDRRYKAEHESTD